FTKANDVNPIILPRPGVAWEATATFNPAAVVRDGQVYVLYRAEDASGDLKIGGHTSRIGLAQSVDGLRFTRGTAPVLFPDSDAHRRYDCTGRGDDTRYV